MKDSRTPAFNNFQQVYTRKQPLPEAVKQEYHQEMTHIIERLDLLLPTYQACVDPPQYARDKDELQLLTACANDESLDIYALEQLLINLHQLQKVFATGLHRQLEPVV